MSIEIDIVQDPRTPTPYNVCDGWNWEHPLQRMARDCGWYVPVWLAKFVDRSDSDHTGLWFISGKNAVLFRDELLDHEPAIYLYDYSRLLRQLDEVIVRGRALRICI
jgi:hypothetical protein